MTNRDPAGVRITRIHSNAICTEIGERLRASLKGGSGCMPPHLVRLTEMLDGAGAQPSAVKNGTETVLR